jgi:hypothetical protein
MPGYYFNVHNVSPSAGDLGEELPDNEAAWQRATVIAGAAFGDADLPRACEAEMRAHGHAVVPSIIQRREAQKPRQ